MKIKLLICFLIFTFFLFSKEPPINKNITYIQMGVSHTDFKDFVIIPTIAIGKRIAVKSSAIDISVNGGYSDCNLKIRYLHAPKIKYIGYLNPKRAHSLFYAMGLSWSYIKNKERHSTFSGISANLSLGTEFNRKASFCQFLQLEASQPAAAAKQKGPFPYPIVELALGIGF